MLILPQPIDDIRIGLDVDGVLANFQRAVINKARVLGYSFYDHYTEWTSWSAEQDYPKTFAEIWDELDDEFWLYEVPPIEKAHVNFQVDAYFTARSLVPNGLTEAWLDMHGFPEAPVYRVDESHEKEDHLMNEGIEIYVDDKPETVENLQRSEYEGLELLMLAPHNIDSGVYPRIQYLNQLHDFVESPVEFFVGP